MNHSVLDSLLPVKEPNVENVLDDIMGDEIDEDLDNDDNENCNVEPQTDMVVDVRHSTATEPTVGNSMKLKKIEEHETNKINIAEEPLLTSNEYNQDKQLHIHNENRSPSKEPPHYDIGTISSTPKVISSENHLQYSKGSKLYRAPNETQLACKVDRSKSKHSNSSTVCNTSKSDSTTITHKDSSKNPPSELLSVKEGFPDSSSSSKNSSCEKGKKFNGTENESASKVIDTSSIGYMSLCKSSAISRPCSTRRGNMRYFVIKTHSQKHLKISIENSIWSTQPHNESKLNEAFENSEVILIFSVNNSRHFQGYCRMISKIGKQTNSIWSDGGSILGGDFNVEWISLYNLPFEDTHQLRNPWNGNKLVKISRDGQELPSNIGSQLCKLIDEGAAATRKRRVQISNVTSLDGEQSFKRTKICEVASASSIDSNRKSALSSYPTNCSLESEERTVSSSNSSSNELFHVHSSSSSSSSSISSLPIDSGDNPIANTSSASTSSSPRSAVANDIKLSSFRDEYRRPNHSLQRQHAKFGNHGRSQQQSTNLAAQTTPKAESVEFKQQKSIYDQHGNDHYQSRRRRHFRPFPQQLQSESKKHQRVQSQRIDHYEPSKQLQRIDHYQAPQRQQKQPSKWDHYEPQQEQQQQQKQYASYHYERDRDSGDDIISNGRNRSAYNERDFMARTLNYPLATLPRHESVPAGTISVLNGLQLSRTNTLGSTPMNLLSMSYGDYLKSISEKFSNVWNPYGELEYLHYLNWLRQQHQLSNNVDFYTAMKTYRSLPRKLHDGELNDFPR